MYQNQHPELVSKIVCLDVGILRSPSVVHALVIVFYQLWFAFSYLISQSLSHTLGNFIFSLFYVLRLAKTVGPCPYDTPHRPYAEIDVSMCYPYYHFWKSAIFGPKLTTR